MTKTIRIGMIVPSLNTIAEDDFRRYCPSDVAYHVHRIRLRKEPGRVTMDDLKRAYLEATEAAGSLKDLRPDTIVFNCTGASVANGVDGDARLAERMTEALGVPCTNTMIAIKEALAALGMRKILHICPFADEFSAVERAALEASGIAVVRSEGLNFTDAREAALMEPSRLVEIAKSKVEAGIDGVLLSCANVRAFEAAPALEQALDLPVVNSNGAVLWHVLKLAGRQPLLGGAGRLFSLH
jgi:maleate isomerase